MSRPSSSFRPFAWALRCRRRSLFAACPCCSSFVPRLGFCWSCGEVSPLLSSLLPVLLFAVLAASSCSRRSVPAQVPCAVQVQELEQGQFFQGAAVVPGAASAQAVWFQFQCQFPAWVGSASVFSLSVAGEQEAAVELEVSVVGGLQGFWVPLRSLPAGWQRVQWRAGGQVGAR